MPPQARHYDTPGLMTCDRQGDAPTGSTAFLSWHQISTETSPGSRRDSFQSSALWFSPAGTGRPGEVSAQRGWRCSRWGLQPPHRTGISAALAGVYNDRISGYLGLGSGTGIGIGVTGHRKHSGWKKMFLVLIVLWFLRHINYQKSLKCALKWTCFIVLYLPQVQ